VTILPELGDTRRFSSSRHAVRYAGLDITVHQSDQRRAPGHLSRQGPPALRWALFEAAQAARRPSSPDRGYYDQAADRSAATAPAWRSRGSCSSAASTPCASSATTPCSPPDPASGARPAPRHSDAPRSAPRMSLPPPLGGRPPKTERPQRLALREDPINHHVTDRPHGAVADRDKPGHSRAHHSRSDSARPRRADPTRRSTPTPQQRDLTPEPHDGEATAVRISPSTPSERVRRQAPTSWSGQAPVRRRS
jgi:hypothetical protein